MNKKCIVALLTVFVLAFGVLTIEAYADGCCSKSKKGSGGLGEKFYRKAGFVLSQQEDLKLSDEQAAKIKQLKMETKKGLIRKKAELDILLIDVKAELHKDTIDTAVVNKLIDQKYDLKKEMAKDAVGACVTLKGILTQEQVSKMKDLKKQCMMGMKKGKMSKGKMGHSMME